MAQNVDLDRFADTWIEYLDQYEEEIAAGIEVFAEQTAVETLGDIVQNSPERTGDYKKGWKERSESTGHKTRRRIYNATDWQLIHLLEFGHVTRLGTGRAKVKAGKQEEAEPRPHVLPAHDRHVPKFYEGVKRILGGGRP